MNKWPPEQLHLPFYNPVECNLKRTERENKRMKEIRMDRPSFKRCEIVACLIGFT